jgi:hypothetical protein
MPLNVKKSTYVAPISMILQIAVDDGDRDFIHLIAVSSNVELRDLYSSPSIIRIIKSRRMRWAGHVARMGEKRNAYRLLVGKPEE